MISNDRTDFETVLFFPPIHLHMEELSKMVKWNLSGIFREASFGCSWTPVAKSMLHNRSPKWMTDNFILA